MLTRHYLAENLQMTGIWKFKPDSKRHRELVEFIKTKTDAFPGVKSPSLSARVSGKAGLELACSARRPSRRRR